MLETVSHTYHESSNTSDPTKIRVTQTINVIENRILVADQVCRVKSVHLSPVTSWREELKKGQPLRMEFLVLTELIHKDQLLQAQVRIPTRVLEGGLSVSPLGIESGTPLIPGVDTIRKRAARPAIVNGAVHLDETGLPVIDEVVEGLAEVPTLAVLRFVPIHSGRGLKISGGTFTPKFYPVPGGGMLPARTAQNHGAVQTGWLDVSGAWAFVEIPRQFAEAPGALSLIAKVGGKVPAFAMTPA